MGSIKLELQGIIGYARITAGDQFQVQIRYAGAKWKSKGTYDDNTSQRWSLRNLSFKCRRDSMLEIRVEQLQKQTPFYSLIPN